MGVAVKQRARSWADGYAVQAIIDPDEPYFIITKGVVQVPNEGLTDPAKGDEVYIAADGTLSTGSGDNPFGRIVEIGGERGTPLDRIRVDLDLKYSM